MDNSSEICWGEAAAPGFLQLISVAAGYFIKRRGPLRGTLSPGEELQYKERRNRGHPQIILPLTLR